MQDSFVITELSRQDLEELGFEADAIDDETMTRMANKLGDWYVEHNYCTSLLAVAELMGIPKKED